MTDDPLYIKTPKGVEELKERRHGLSQRLRNLLLLVNGKRHLSDFATLFPGEDVPSTFGTLVDGGFIEPATPALGPVPPAPATEAERFQLAQSFMVNTVAALLGVMGSGVIEKLERCENIEELRALYGKWREAIHVSAEGRKQAQELESRLNGLLG